jgi:hypothetical protein
MMYILYFYDLDYSLYLVFIIIVTAKRFRWRGGPHTPPFSYCRGKSRATLVGCKVDHKGIETTLSRQSLRAHSKDLGGGQDRLLKAESRSYDSEVDAVTRWQFAIYASDALDDDDASPRVA